MITSPVYSNNYWLWYNYYDNYIRMVGHLFIGLLEIIVKRAWNYCYPMELKKT